MQSTGRDIVVVDRTSSIAVVRGPWDRIQRPSPWANPPPCPCGARGIPISRPRQDQAAVVEVEPLVVVVATGGERSPHRRCGTDSWAAGPESQERPCMVGGSSAGGASVVGRPEELISRRSWLVIDPATDETLLKKDLHCLDSGNTVEVTHTQDP